MTCTSWKRNFFPQAIAAKYLLRQGGTQCTLYLGASFKARMRLEAQVWLRYGSLNVTCGAGHTHCGTLGMTILPEDKPALTAAA